jgi:hypothetical protein
MPLRSYQNIFGCLRELDYAVEPKLECPDNDPNDDVIIRATATIEGYDAVKEYITCKMYLLAAGFGFHSVALDMTPMLKVEIPLPLFAVENIATEHANRVLVEIETEAERVLGSFGLKEYDALGAANILNGSRLN